MGLVEIAASIAAALSIGLLTRGAWRTYLLLAVSVFAVYWLQPALPLRSVDFWLPSLTLALVVLTWSVTAQPDAWRARQNVIALSIILGVPIFLVLSRYLFSESILAASTPSIILYAAFLVGVTIAVLALTWLAGRGTWVLPVIIVLLIAILVALKTPELSLQVSILFRTLLNRPIDNALATDLRWLGFSYIAFRLIHVLRDRSRSPQFPLSRSERNGQTGRLPELSLAEFGTYVVFFPSLVAGPIDRAERFAQDLRKEFQLTQEETLFAGQRLAIGLFKKFVIADVLAWIALNDTLSTQVRTTGWMWVIVYAYAFQIYFDFSGYTDIAIGVARFAGVKLPENFAGPYLKPNLTQFWNSWHMTLTQWIRSYFFNPFNRWIRGYKSIPAWGMIFIGQVATMLIIGLWHGITLNFVLWGLWHGLGLFVQNRWSDFAKTRFSGSNPRFQSAFQIGGILLTFHFVALGWVFFALSSPSLSWHVLLKLLGLL